MLILYEALEHMVGGQHNSVRVNAEAAADDFDRTFRCWLCRPLDHCYGGILYRIGNVSCAHGLIRHAVRVRIDAMLFQDRRSGLDAI